MKKNEKQQKDVKKEKRTAREIGIHQTGREIAIIVIQANGRSESFVKTEYMEITQMALMDLLLKLAEDKELKKGVEFVRLTKEEMAQAFEKLCRWRGKGHVEIEKITEKLVLLTPDQREEIGKMIERIAGGR